MLSQISDTPPNRPPIDRDRTAASSTREIGPGAEAPGLFLHEASEPRSVVPTEDSNGRRTRASLVLHMLAVALLVGPAVGVGDIVGTWHLATVGDQQIPATSTSGGTAVLLVADTLRLTGERTRRQQPPSAPRISETMCRGAQQVARRARECAMRKSWSLLERQRHELARCGRWLQANLPRTYRIPAPADGCAYVHG